MLVGLIAQTAIEGDLRIIVLTVAWCVLILAILYAVMVRPIVKIFDEGIEIVNPITRHTIPWNDVARIDARYAMSIVTKNGQQIFAWAAPAPSRYHSRKIHESDLKGLNLATEGGIRPGESPRSDSGVARYLAVARFEKFNAATTASIKREFVRDWTIPMLSSLAIVVILFFA